MENGHISLDGCTDEHKENCERHAGEDSIINPVRSARLNTKNSFSFKYGHVEVIAKMPEGDWLWPGRKTYFFITKDCKYLIVVVIIIIISSYLASTY